MARYWAFDADHGVTLAAPNSSFSTTSGDEHLYVARIERGSGTPKLVDVQRVAGGMTAQPVWSPDGTHLAYLTLQNRRFELWSMAVSTTDEGPIGTGVPARLTGDRSIDATSRPLWLSQADADRLSLASAP